MCGIFAYINHKTPVSIQNIISVLLNGLSRLEYRGYDSSGLAIDGDYNTSIIKSKGNVDKLRKKCNELISNKDEKFTSHLGIAHTRWATHGKPNDINSHPHSSNENNTFTVVHNGIITNFSEIKIYLNDKGYKFLSCTDTEVISKLIQYYYDIDKQMSFRELVEKSIVHLEGSFAIVVKGSPFPNECVACCHKSPLLIGVKSPCGELLTNKLELNNMINLVPLSTGIEFFMASDASAIIEHTKQIIYLEDNDIVHIVSGDISVNNVQNGTREIQSVEMDIHQIMCGNYDFFMMKEIMEQPETLKNTMRGRMMDFPYSLLECLNQYIDVIRKSRRLIFIACGTSYHSCLSVRPFLEEITKIPIDIELASDFMDRQCPIFRDDTCFFISQSGETADTLNTLRYCRSQDALIVGIVNTVGSSISRESHCCVYLNIGPEIGVASTKAYTSQIVCLIMLGIMMGYDKISVQKRISEVSVGLKNLPSLVEEVLKVDKQIEELSHKIWKSNSLLIMGRGYQYATCLEGALKIKEITYMHSEGILSGELKHGPLALIDEHMLVCMIVIKDSTFNKSINALQQVYAREGRPIVITTKECVSDVKPYASSIIIVPSTIDCIQPILTIIPLQLLSYHIAIRRGLNVDFPRNLAKSVTVE